MTLLCATHFSPESIAASTVAAELARQRGENLWLVFVAPAHASAAWGEGAMASADARLKAEAQRLRALGATVTPAMLVGKPHQELERFTRENGISLVVAGDASSGSSGSGVLGRLGRALTVPMLTVRDAAPLVAWARGKRALKIMVGVDATQSTAVAARFVEGLARFGAIDVVGGHVFYPSADCARFGLPHPRTWDEASPELLAALRRELQAALPYPIQFKAALGRVSDVLCALAEEEQVDLLVFGSHHRRALGRLSSVSEQSLARAAMSVICVPASAAPEPAMQTIDRILIATDFSTAGNRAIAWGLATVARGGTVDLVHVTSTPAGAEEERRIREQLEARVPPEARTPGLTIATHAVCAETPAEGILTSAERFASSAICLGTRGAGLVRAVFGSNALAVLEASRRPVLVVPPPEA